MSSRFLAADHRMTGTRTRRIGWPFASLVVLGVAWFTFTAYQRDIRLARERVATGSLIAQTRCGPIEYQIAGEGPAVLLVHGAGGGFDQGQAFGEALAGRGLRVIAMSRFGYLRTPMPQDASAGAQADAHACLLDALGIPQAAIIGVSAGAPSAMQFALRHATRCSALVLLVPAAYVPRAGGAPPMQTPAWTEFLFDTALRFDFLFWAAPRINRATVTRAILATPPAVIERASAAEQARVNEVLEHILPVSPRRMGLLNDAAVTASLPRYELERIAAPTLVISAADDLFGTFDGARYTAEHIPGARFIGYPSGGHLWVGHQEDVVAEIAGFLLSRAGLKGRSKGSETRHVERAIPGERCPIERHAKNIWVSDRAGMFEAERRVELLKQQRNHVAVRRNRESFGGRARYDAKDRSVHPGLRLAPRFPVIERETRVHPGSSPNGRPILDVSIRERSFAKLVNDVQMQTKLLRQWCNRV